MMIIMMKSDIFRELFFYWRVAHAFISRTGLIGPRGWSLGVAAALLVLGLVLLGLTVGRALALLLHWLRGLLPRRVSAGTSGLMDEFTLFPGLHPVLLPLLRVSIRAGTGALQRLWLG